MGDSFELEFQKRIAKIREQLGKKEIDVRRKATDIQKIKVEALKKTEEMKYSAQHDLERIGQDIMKAKDLDNDVKTRITSEISNMKNEIERKYSELKSAVADKAVS